MASLCFILTEENLNSLCLKPFLSSKSLIGALDFNSFFISSKKLLSTEDKAILIELSFLLTVPSAAIKPSK